MAKTLSTGSAVAIASTYSTAKTFSSITNATEAVASFAADPSLVANDYIEVTSGWGRLNQRVVRVKTVSGTGPYLVTFEKMDTSDTNKYPAGSGAGSVRKITAWTSMSQIKDLSTSGGDQQFADVTAIDDVVTQQMPTVRSAQSMTMTIFDDPTLAWYDVVRAASEAATPVALRMTFPNTTYLVANAYWSLNQVPSVTKNDALTTQVTLSYAAQAMRY